jgi:hypothetical protein
MNRDDGPEAETVLRRAIEIVRSLPDDVTWEKILHTLWRRKEFEQAVAEDLRNGVYDKVDPAEKGI